MADSIVITGWGMVTPLGPDAPSTWKALFNGGAQPRVLAGPGWEGFGKARAMTADPRVPKGLEGRDRSLQLGICAAEEAWEAARLGEVPSERTGCTFSSSKGGLLSLLKGGTGDFLTDFFPHTAGQLMKQRFGFRGPTLSVSSACSTGLGSLSEGARLLLDGECDAVLTGSTESSLHPLIYAGFRNMNLLSGKDGGPSPFDRGRDGFVMGEGSAAMILEREEAARSRKAPILARLSGWALGADAHAALEMEPKGGTIGTVVRKALHRAGLEPGDIGYVNAHGTGTRSNDALESRALREVFGSDGAFVSSTKGATGHLLGAAGSVEAVLSALALGEGELPDTRNLSDPDPECAVRHVARGGMRTKVAHVMSLSYGFGGQLGAVVFSKI